MENNNIFSDILSVLETQKQEKVEDSTIAIVRKMTDIDIPQEVDYGFFEIINYVMRVFGFEEITEQEYIELMSVDIFKDITIPKKYFDIFLMIKIFGIRIVKRIMQYRKQKKMEERNDNNDFRQDRNGENISFEATCEDNSEKNET